MRGLRLMIYDDTCRGKRARPGLTHSWIAGGLLYQKLGRLDAYHGVRSWEEGLRWLLQYQPDRPIDEIQYWGHGKWGRAMVDGDRLDRFNLQEGDRLRPLLDGLRERVSGEGALWWFRTCETLGAQPGHDFAMAWGEFFGSRVAGHSFIIGPWQSGLHSLWPGAKPSWSLNEGLAEGSPALPKEALWSSPTQPNTISCLHGAIPEGW